MTLEQFLVAVLEWNTVQTEQYSLMKSRRRRTSVRGAEDDIFEEVYGVEKTESHYLNKFFYYFKMATCQWRSFSGKKDGAN